jgi:hypothetical protein
LSGLDDVHAKWRRRTFVDKAEKAFLVESDGTRPTRRPKHLGADEIHRGKAQKFYTVLSDLVHGEVIGLAQARTHESLTSLLTTSLDAQQRVRQLAGKWSAAAPIAKTIKASFAGAKLVARILRTEMGGDHMEAENDATEQVNRSRDFLTSNLPVDLLVAGVPFVENISGVRGSVKISNVSINNCRLSLSREESSHAGIDSPGARSVGKYDIDMTAIELPVTVVETPPDGKHRHFHIDVKFTNPTTVVQSFTDAIIGKSVDSRQQANELSIPVKDQSTGDQIAQAFGVIVEFCKAAS